MPHQLNPYLDAGLCQGTETPSAPASGQQPKKLLLFGDAGSGKTTLAAVISSATGANVLNLDHVQFGPNWESKSSSEVQRIVAEFQMQDAWIVEGNLPPRSESLVSNADVVIWVDTPFSVSTARLAKRVWSDYCHRRPVCNGNRDSFWRLINPWNSCVAKKIRKHRRKRREFKKLIQHVPHVVLRSDDDIFGFLFFNYEDVRRMKPRSYQDILKEVNREH